MKMNNKKQTQIFLYENFVTVSINYPKYAIIKIPLAMQMCLYIFVQAPP